MPSFSLSYKEDAAVEYEVSRFEPKQIKAKTDGGKVSLHVYVSRDGMTFPSSAYSRKLVPNEEHIVGLDVRPYKLVRVVIENDALADANVSLDYAVNDSKADAKRKA